MDISTISFEITNMVLLAQNLQQAPISRDALTALFPDERPEYIDVPQFLAVRFPQHRSEVLSLIDQNRLEFKVSAPTEADWPQVPVNMLRVYSAFSNTPITFYGFNIVVSLPASGGAEAKPFIVEQFRASLEPIAQQLEGEIYSFLPSIKYQKNGMDRQLKVETRRTDPYLMNLHFNIEFTAATLPAEDEFSQSYLDFKEDVVATVERLFN